MILSGKSIRELGIISPHEPRTQFNGMSYGESYAGYDIRVNDKRIFLEGTRHYGLEGTHRWIETSENGEFDFGFYEVERLVIPQKFSIGITFEHFKMPKNVLGVVHDKSSWARQGLSVFNTIIEPGWEGFLTLELVNHGQEDILLTQGIPIAQVIFHYVDEPTEGYDGKYQNAKQIPQEAILA